MFPFYTDKRVSDMFPFYTDKRGTDKFPLYTDKFPFLTDKFPHAPKVFPLSHPYPIKPSFRKKHATVSKKDAEKFSVFFLVAGEGLEPPASGL